MSRPLRVVAALLYGAAALAVTLVAIVLLSLAALGRASSTTELLTFLAMSASLLLWGAVWGLGAAQLVRPRDAARPWLRRGLWALVALGVLAIALGTARPARERQDERLVGAVLLAGSLLLLRWRAVHDEANVRTVMSAA